MSNYMLWYAVTIVAIVVVAAFGMVSYCWCKCEIEKIMNKRRAQKQVLPVAAEVANPVHVADTV